MFIAALFMIAIPPQNPQNTIVKTWKQPKCLSIMNGSMEYYSAMTKNEIMPLAATWVDLEIIILSEVRQIPCAITYIGGRRRRG